MRTRASAPRRMTPRRTPRTLDVPRELSQGFKDDPAASAAFAAMPPSHREAYVSFVDEAKRPETKVRRVQQALRMIAQWGADHARRARGRLRRAGTRR